VFSFLFSVLLFFCNLVFWLCVAFERSLNSCLLLGKHSLKKDDYLTTMMLVPPKQRMRISHFDAKTQEDAFTVSLEGLKGVRHLFLSHSRRFSSCDIILLYSGMSTPSCWNPHKPGKTGKNGCVISFGISYLLICHILPYLSCLLTERAQAIGKASSTAWWPTAQLSTCPTTFHRRRVYTPTTCSGSYTTENVGIARARCAEAKHWDTTAWVKSGRGRSSGRRTAKIDCTQTWIGGSETRIDHNNSTCG
jgi:hypothetical protein